ncbi:MAG: hypothetical protein ABFD08_18235 [Syntrophomonas sp.]
MIETMEVQGKQDLRQFMELADRIYHNDHNWVPPLRFLLRSTIRHLCKPRNEVEPSTLFLAREGNDVLGRICVGIDHSLNDVMDTRAGYISLFECVDSYEVAERLFDKAAEWLRERGICMMRGPISPANSDDCRALLVEGFDGPPFLMNPYNPAYYPRFFDQYGFEKETDFYAFHIDLKRYPVDLYQTAVSRAMIRFSVRIDKVSFIKLERDITDIKTIIDQAWPDDWADMLPPSREDLLQMSKKQRWVSTMDGMLIARSGDRPVGFIISMPDYNQAIKPMQGRILPWGIFKFLWYQRKITAGRVMVLFVVPEFRRKVVAEALFCKLIATGRSRRYLEAEASIIGEHNRVMLQTVQAIGGEKYRTYRIYKKNL